MIYPEECPGALENNVYSFVLGLNILYIFIKCLWSVLSKTSEIVFSLIFCLRDLSINASGVLRSLILLYYYQPLSLFFLIFALYI